MKQKPSIWLIDDDQTVIEIFERAFAKEQLGCQITTFTDATEFMSSLQQAPLPPALLLVDYYLLGTTGLTLIEQLRRAPATRSLKTVLYSQRMSTDILGKAEKMGIYQVASKPFDFKEWRQFVRELCLSTYSA
ncbi:hypothetical protein GCM10027347_11600 [Larkinella harenae]